MSCDVRDHIQRQIYFFGAYEPIEAYLFELLMQPGMVVIDAGANVGQYALIAAMEVGHGGEVHAFEPVPSTFQRLAAHVVENELAARVRVNMTALWHRVENLTLHLRSEMVGNAGAYTIATPSKAVDTVTSVGVRLDDYVAEQGLQRVDFIKMDIEGAEWFALRGATAVISRWRPTMLVEINRELCRELGYEPERIWQLLKPHGYVMWAVGGSPDTCRSLSSLDGVDRANVIFHTAPLPDAVTRGWSLKSVLRFHRR
jgi:FkbM family methyltransferase